MFESTSKNQERKKKIFSIIFQFYLFFFFKLKSKICSQILSLNGEIGKIESGYDVNCTHVLCEKPSRSERIFSSIAAGKWILSLQYIEDSVEAGYFLNVSYHVSNNTYLDYNLNSIMF